MDMECTSEVWMRYQDISHISHIIAWLYTSGAVIINIIKNRDMQLLLDVQHVCKIKNRGFATNDSYDISRPFSTS